MVRTQLTHENVQKSMSTTLPRSSDRVSGGLLSQPSIPTKLGASWRSLTGNTEPSLLEAVAGGAGMRITVAVTATTTSTATAASARRYRDIACPHYTIPTLNEHYGPGPACA